MGSQYGLIFNLERCIGCEACTVACKIENNFITDTIQVKTLNTINKDTPTGSFLQGNLRMEFQPHTCNHCEDPPCVEACSFNALIQRDDGIVVLNQDNCTGCQTCVTACPYGAIHFNKDSNIAEKCNLCSHRIDQGLEPFCVICCEGQAIYFGDWNTPQGKFAVKDRKDELYVRNPEFNTKPKIKYLPLKKPRGL
ncbi:MAG: 4Fe-4S dicluster domain-containing protein [Candidatus Lokiarchaeota archaeon]|nr:4Fe-4S dicluster domain-containing protein [Candidatus Lokiarchaeota archaeon]